MCVYVCVYMYVCIGISFRIQHEFMKYVNNASAM